jgi:Skp family chaperone for outer membrane proteins
MKKVTGIILALLIATSLNSFALDIPLMDMRNKIFEESKVMKKKLANSKDIIFLNSMWDSCVIAINQLDAYFSLVGIFNTIKKENLTEASVGYLISWLNQTKQTNELNIKNLNSLTSTFEARTKLYKAKLTNIFTELDSHITKELEKLSLLQRSLQKTKPGKKP